MLQISWKIPQRLTTEQRALWGSLKRALFPQRKRAMHLPFNGEAALTEGKSQRPYCRTSMCNKTGTVVCCAESKPPDIHQRRNQTSLKAQGLPLYSEEATLPNMSALRCELCNINTRKLRNMKQHCQQRHGKKMLQCEDCSFVPVLRYVATSAVIITLWLTSISGKPWKTMFWRVTVPPYPNPAALQASPALSSSTRLKIRIAWSITLSHIVVGRAVPNTAFPGTHAPTNPLLLFFSLQKNRRGAEAVTRGAAGNQHLQLV